jgi:NitT/TauT family transport system substrate-binding protein
LGRIAPVPAKICCGSPFACASSRLESGRERVLIAKGNANTRLTMLHRTKIVCALAALLLTASPAAALDKVTFGTNWVAEAEHGGFYQAVADGTYKKYGLDVTIIPGGPSVNNRILLPARKLDFVMAANIIQAFDTVQQKIPTIAIAAIFQKDPQVLLAHPGRGIETFADLKKLNILVSSEGTATYYPWLKSEHGFSDDQVRPYTFNPQPFLVNKNVAMQGYVTSEPYVIEREGKFKPKIFLLADHGFDTYSTTIETRIELIEKNPGLVQRFVDASIIGWYNYLYGDNAAANALIKAHNPEMTDDLIAYSIDKMKEYGIVDSGDALTLGIGAITEARIRSFHDKMLKAGVIKPGLDWRKAFTTAFVNRKVGLELRPK